MARPAPPSPARPLPPSGLGSGLGGTARLGSGFSELRRFGGRSSEPRPAPPRRVLAPAPPARPGGDLAWEGLVLRQSLGTERGEAKIEWALRGGARKF